MARDCLSQSGSFPLAFNAANEVAAEAFRVNRIGFVQISNIIEDTLSQINAIRATSLDELLDLDKSIRSVAERCVENQEG